MAEPMLLRLRTGKIAARVISYGFGGGTMLLGIGSVLVGRAHGGGVLGGIVAYALGALPFFLLGGVVARCRSELWLVPEAKAFRLLTFRPWRRGPRVEQAPLGDYAGVRTDPAQEKHGGGTLVSLVAADGEVVAMRQFVELAEAKKFAQDLGSAAGIWVRHSEEGKS